MKTFVPLVARNIMTAHYGTALVHDHRKPSAEADAQ